MLTIRAGGRSMRKPGQREGKGSNEIAAHESARLRFARQAEGGDCVAHQLLNTRVAIGVAYRQSGGSSVADQSLLFAAELAYDVAAGLLKQRIRGIFFGQWADDVQ